MITDHYASRLLERLETKRAETEHDYTTALERLKQKVTEAIDYDRTPSGVFIDGSVTEINGLAGRLTALRIAVNMVEEAIQSSTQVANA